MGVFRPVLSRPGAFAPEPGVIRQRPEMIGSDPRRFWSLVYTLAKTDYKLRFYGSVLGYLWTLARPFLFFGVIYTVFTVIVGLDRNVPHYGVYILFALVLFQFFAEATGASVASLVNRENLLRKLRFPRLVIPFAVVLTSLFNLGMTLVAVTVFAVFNGVYPSWGWLELAPIVALLAALSVGVGLLLSSLYVRYRDIQPIWEVVSQALFYASPVLYVSTMVPANVQHPYHANPISALLGETRAAVVDPTAPHCWDLIGGAPRLAIPFGIIVAVLVLGFVVFHREAPRIAENL